MNQITKHNNKFTMIIKIDIEIKTIHIKIKMMFNMNNHHLTKMMI